MAEVVVEVVFNMNIPQDLMCLIERQKGYIDELFHTGVILDYSVSRDKKTLWITFEGKTPEEVSGLMNDFPLFHYMSYHIRPMETH